MEHSIASNFWKIKWTFSFRRSNKAPIFMPSSRFSFLHLRCGIKKSQNAFESKHNIWGKVLNEIKKKYWVFTNIYLHTPPPPPPFPISSLIGAQISPNLWFYDTESNLCQCRKTECLKTHKRKRTWNKTGECLHYEHKKRDWFYVMTRQVLKSSAKFTMTSRI